MRALTRFAVIVWAGAAFAAPAVAVHPLELAGFEPSDRDRLRAGFEVLLARQQGIRLAGSRIDFALESEAGHGCEQRDGCLRFLAEATDALYGVYVKLELDPLGKEARATGRVVRSDGVRVRAQAAATSPVEGTDVLGAGRAALTDLLQRLELAQLPEALPEAPLTPAAAEPPPPAKVEVRGGPALPSALDVRRTLGWSLVGLGATGVLTSAILAGLALGERNGLEVQPSGAVSEANASAAAVVVRLSRTATTMLVAGAALAAVGALLALWPFGEPGGAAVSLSPAADGASLVLTGRLP